MRSNPLAEIITSSGPAGVAFTTLARVVGNAAAAITQASLSSISYKIFNESSDTPDTAVETGTLTVSSVVFDTLQTDARWTKDTTGYNFRNVVAGTNITGDGRRYLVEYLFTPTSGAAFVVQHRHTTTTWRSA